MMKNKIRQALENLDASEKQINAIIMKCKVLKKEEQAGAIEYIENVADDLQDIFDYLQKDNDQQQSSNYIDLRDYPNIPANAVKQFCEHPDGFWFRLMDRGEWIFVKKENLENVRFKWSGSGEVLFLLQAKTPSVR